MRALLSSVSTPSSAQGRDGTSRVAGQDASGGYGRGGCNRAAAADADEMETAVIVTEEGLEEREENFSTRPFRKEMHCRCAWLTCVFVQY